MPLNGTQPVFARALLTRGSPPPSLRLSGEAEGLDRRFGIYRNTVFASLAAVLRARFPAVEALVGEEFFQGMAVEFAAAHPPETPVLLEYGSQFAPFIADFGPAREIPYLADVAAFEWARHEAAHAADAEAVSLDALTAVDSARLGEVRLTLHPAARLFRSDFPAATLWRINTGGDAPSGELSGPEYALIARPDVSVSVFDLSPGAFELLTQLASGAPLGAALAAAQETQSDFDLPATLALIFSAGAIAAVTLS